MIAGAAILGILTGAVSSLLISPHWTVSTTLEIQDINNDFLNTRQVTPLSEDTAANSYFSDMQTEIQILESNKMLDRAVAEVTADRVKRGDASNAVRRELEAIRGKLKARVRGQTRIIELSALSANPALTAEFLNQLAKDAMDENVTSRIEMSQAIGGWLAQLLKQAQERLRSSEDSLEAYAKNNGLLFTSDNKSVAEESLRQIQGELAKVEALRAEKQSRYEAAKSTPATAVPDVLNDSSLRQYEDQLTDLRRQRAELSAVYTPDYTKIKRLDAQIASLQTALNQEKTDIYKRIENEYQQAERRQALLTAQLEQLSRNVSDVNQRSIQYDILKHEVDSNRQLYDAMLQRVKEASIASAIQPSNIRIIDEAVVPKSKTYPKMVVNCCLGFLLFSSAAMLVAFARERSDSTLKAPGEGNLLLNLAELGVVPHVSRGMAAKAAKSGSLGLNSQKSKLGTNPAQLYALGPKRQAHLIGESFRSIATSILFSESESGRPQVIVVTSAGPNEGKTSVVANVGAALARGGKRVLLIDGDLRRRRLGQVFGIDSERGLSNVLRGELASEADAGVCTEITTVIGLSVLPAGSIYSDSPDLLHSARLAQVIENLRREYDFILIDTPPLLDIPDGRLLARLADGVVFVARCRQTTIEASWAACQQLAFDRARLLGMVLNDWDPNNSATGYYGSYTTKSYDVDRSATLIWQRNVRSERR